MLKKSDNVYTGQIDMTIHIHTVGGWEVSVYRVCLVRRRSERRLSLPVAVEVGWVPLGVYEAVARARYHAWRLACRCIGDRVLGDGAGRSSGDRLYFT